MEFIYYTLTTKESLILHFWYRGKYRAYDCFSDSIFFQKQVDWLISNSTFYKISYRGGHIEKPMLVLINVLFKEGRSIDDIYQKVLELNQIEGSPSKRLGKIFKDLKLNANYYSDYLEILSHPLMLDIETFDGRIYHNSFDRLEIQLQLKPAQNATDYLSHLEMIFQSQAFQEVFLQKKYLLERFRGNFHIAVNETTTDAQLTESFYAKAKLKDAYSVFIPRRYAGFTYFLHGNLLTLYECYQSKNPKTAIKKHFGKNGAITELPHFIISSGASAPIGFQIEDYNPKKAWTSQIKTKRFEKAIRLDLTHIQSYIMLETVKNSYFKKQLAWVLESWQKEPENRSALNRLLYPIQGSMDTPFDHDLHTPNYAYSMRLVHNLLLVGLLKTLIDEGMSPISLNNEVIFFEQKNFNQKRFEKHLAVLGVYFDYHLVDNLIIKDTNNYTYFDLRTQNHVFRGASFNHHQGADVTSNMDTPPIIDWVLQKMISETGDLDDNLVFPYLNAFLKENDLDKIKEYFMIPIYPIKQRYQYLFKNNDYQQVLSANAYFASSGKSTWRYRQFYESKKKSADRLPAILEKYQLNTTKCLQEVENSRLNLEEIDKLQIESLDLFYYASLVSREIELWR